MNLRGGGTGARPLRVLGAALLVAMLGGCAASGAALPPRPAASTLQPGSPLLSRTLENGDAWLRHHLMRGDYDAALHLLRRSAARPKDRLLRSLQEGVVLHYAGRYGESNRAFEWAEREADRRVTKSIRRGAGSLVLNDRVLAYTPSAGELAIIPYFRMLNYLALGTLDGAAVEARKSSAAIARLGSGAGEACAGFGMIEYLAGLVYGTAGEANHALVSLRHAERSLAGCRQPGWGELTTAVAGDLLSAARVLGVEDIADSVASRYTLPSDPADPESGDLIVFIEHGFAAHRAQQDLYVPILRDDVERAEAEENADLFEIVGLVTARVAASLGESLYASPRSPEAWQSSRHARLSGEAQEAELAQVLRLAWPVMQLEASRPPSVRLLVDGAAVPAVPLEDVSARLVRDLESRRAAILSRMVARAVIKYLAAHEAEEKAEKEGGRVLGFLVGLFTNAAANALEQADTRTWSLLPDQISMARIRVPAGQREVRLELRDAHGYVNRVVELGPVQVEPGARVFLSHRVWGADPGDADRLARLGLDVFSRSTVPEPPLIIRTRTARAARARPRPASPSPAAEPAPSPATAPAPPSGTGTEKPPSRPDRQRPPTP